MQSYALVKNAHTHRQKVRELSICRDSLAGSLLLGISITASFPSLWSDASSALLLYLCFLHFFFFHFSVLSLFPLLFFSLLLYFLLLYFFYCPLCMYHIVSLTHSRISFTLPGFLCLSPPVSLFLIVDWVLVTVCLSSFPKKDIPSFYLCPWIALYPHTEPHTDPSKRETKSQVCKL